MLNVDISLKRDFFNQRVSNGGGGGGRSNPIFAHGKMCVFPFFPMGKNGEKSIWKEREMNTFPFLCIYFILSIYFIQHTFFHGQKWGWTPPPQAITWYVFLHHCDLSIFNEIYIYRRMHICI